MNITNTRQRFTVGKAMGYRMYWSWDGRVMASNGYRDVDVSASMSWEGFVNDLAEGRSGYGVYKGYEPLNIVVQ